MRRNKFVLCIVLAIVLLFGVNYNKSYAGIFDSLWNTITTAVNNAVNSLSNNNNNNNNRSSNNNNRSSSSSSSSSSSEPPSPPVNEFGKAISDLTSQAGKVTNNSILGWFNNVVDTIKEATSDPAISLALTNTFNKNSNSSKYSTTTDHHTTIKGTGSDATWNGKSSSGSLAFDIGKNAYVEEGTKVGILKSASGAASAKDIADGSAIVQQVKKNNPNATTEEIQAALNAANLKLKYSTQEVVAQDGVLRTVNNNNEAGTYSIIEITDPDGKSTKMPVNVTTVISQNEKKTTTTTKTPRTDPQPRTDTVVTVIPPTPTVPPPTDVNPKGDSNVEIEIETAPIEYDESASIYDSEDTKATDDYDVEVNIPTKEILTFKANTKEYIADIEIQQTYVNVKADATAKFIAFYYGAPLNSKHVIDQYTYDENGKLINHVRTETTEPSNARDIQMLVIDVPVSYAKEKVFYEIPTADIWYLDEIKVWAEKDGSYVLAPNEDGTTQIYKADSSIINAIPKAQTLGISTKKPDSLTATELEKFKFYKYDGSKGSSGSATPYDSRDKAEKALKAYIKESKSQEELENLRMLLKAKVDAAIECEHNEVNFELKTRDGEDLIVVKSNVKDGTTKLVFKEGDLEKTTNRMIDTKKDNLGGIPADYPNGEYKGHSEVTYVSANKPSSDPDYKFVINPNTNNVNILAPVHNTTTIDTPEFVDQRATISSTTNVTQLDEKLIVSVNLEGKQIEAKGYDDNMDTTPWTKEVVIKLPFDAYWIHNDAGIEKVDFKKENTEIILPGSSAINHIVKFEFIVPVWTKEQVYNSANKIYTEVRAVNHNETKGWNGKKEEYNAEHSQYIATGGTDVEVIGKIYDLQVNNSMDPDWLNKVRNMADKTKDYVTADQLPFGRTSGSNGLQSQNTNTQYKYAPKLGYMFAFNFKTKGRKTNSVDISVAENGFYFVQKSNGAVIPVDLYYKPFENEGYIKIATDKNVKSISVVPADAFLKIQNEEFKNSSSIYPIEFNNQYNYKMTIGIGNIARLSLPHNLRFAYNNFKEYMTDNGGLGKYSNSKTTIVQNAKSSIDCKPNETGEQMVIGSVGRWYAGYVLPNTTVAVKKGISTNEAINAIINKDKSKVYTNGYILVTMNLTGINKDVTKMNDITASGTDYLVYKGPDALNSNPTEPFDDWTKPYNPSNPHDPDTTKKVKIQDVPGDVDVPNNTVAIFESDYAATIDYDSGITD